MPSRTFQMEYPWTWKCCEKDKTDSRRNGKVKEERGQLRLESMACDAGSIESGVQGGGALLESKSQKSMS